MKKLTIGLIGLAVAYLVVWVGFGAAMGYFQPQDEGTAVVTTFDSSGAPFRTVIRPVRSDGGQIWLLSGQWFRSWYNRAVENERVELESGGVTTNFIAVAVQDDQEIAEVLKIRFSGVSSASKNIGRLLVLFAPIKVLRLEPES